MDALVGLIGGGPAAEAAAAALAGVGASVEPHGVDDVAGAGLDLAVVVDSVGAGTFESVGIDRWVAVETGGVGGHPLADVDAAVAALTPESAGYGDLCRRVASTVGETPGHQRASSDRSAVRLAGAVAGRRAVALLEGADLGGTVVEVSGADVGGGREFLAVPTGERDRTPRRDHRDASLDDSLARAERALDDRVGLLTTVGERESFPLPYYLAATADTRAYSDTRAAEYAAGADPGWDAAFMKALGEGLERYSAGVYRAAEFVTAPRRTRADPVPPESFVRPADARDPGHETPIGWVDGEALATGESVSLPAAFVHYPPPTEAYGAPITTGLGLGNSGVEALLSGLYEVVERDATMLSWYSTFEPLGLAVDDDGFETMAGRARAEDLTVTPLLVTADVDVPVVAVAVYRETEWPQFALGSGADLDAAAAARSALAEALQNWMELRAMGPEAAREEEAAIGAYASFPAAAHEYVSVDASVPAAEVGPGPVPAGEDELDALVGRVTDAGLDAYASRLTPPDVEQLGFEAVRVLVPAAQPLFTGEPFFGERARTVPESLGFEPRLDREYHPFP